MRVWTIQAPEVLAVLRSGAAWRTDESHVEQVWIPAYRWMAREMRVRRGGHLPRGTAGARIELELDDARLLRSDFELWHYVLNGWSTWHGPIVATWQLGQRGPSRV